MKTPHKTSDKQAVGFRLCCSVIHRNLLIVLSLNRQHKRNLHICRGVLLGKEQSAADMKGTEKSAISQPLPCNICCNISDHIKAPVAHHFYGTARIREKQTWHQVHPASKDKYPDSAMPKVVMISCILST